MCETQHVQLHGKLRIMLGLFSIAGQRVGAVGTASRGGEDGRDGG